MTLYIDPSGQPTYGIALCARCSKKYPLAELSPDPNSPGLMVCDYDRDDFDPYRLPARQTEDITLPFTRPDVPLTPTSIEPFLALGLQVGGYILTTERGAPIELEGIL